MFSTFTNGTLIDEAFAEEMLRVKNFVPAISIEGFEEATDSRRGDGTYQKIIRAMNILKERKLPFGISCCYTSANAEVIGSEAYFDQMIEMGAKFAWFFTYMPVGKGAGTELMATAEQREMMYHKIREYRKTKPIFTVDFWNDGEYVGAVSYTHLDVYKRQRTALLRQKIILKERICWRCRLSVPGRLFRRSRQGEKLSDGSERTLRS